MIFTATRILSCTSGRVNNFLNRLPVLLVREVPRFAGYSLPSSGLVVSGNALSKSFTHDEVAPAVRFYREVSGVFSCPI